jgi:hypothetical protein
VAEAWLQQPKQQVYIATSWPPNVRQTHLLMATNLSIELLNGMCLGSGICFTLAARNALGTWAKECSMAAIYDTSATANFMPCPHLCTSGNQHASTCSTK